VQALDTPARRPSSWSCGEGGPVERNRPQLRGVPRRARLGPPRPGCSSRLGRRGGLLHQRMELPRRPLRPVPDGRDAHPPHRRRARIGEGPSRRSAVPPKGAPAAAVVVLISLSALFAMPYHVLIPIYARRSSAAGPRLRGSHVRGGGRCGPGSLYSASHRVGARKGRPSRRGA